MWGRGAVIALTYSFWVHPYSIVHTGGLDLDFEYAGANGGGLKTANKG